MYHCIYNVYIDVYNKYTVVNITVTAKPPKINDTRLVTGSKSYGPSVKMADASRRGWSPIGRLQDDFFLFNDKCVRWQQWR